MGDEKSCCRLYFQMLIGDVNVYLHPYLRNRLYEKIEDFCLLRNLNMFLRINNWPIDRNLDPVDTDVKEKTEIYGVKLAVTMNFEKVEDAHLFKQDFLVLMKLSGDLLPRN